jgi:hypothetical protein
MAAFAVTAERSMSPSSGAGGYGSSGSSFAVT